MNLDREEYLVLCRARWDGPALADARRNWTDFVELGDTLIEPLRSFKRDPMQETPGGKCLNPDGTLTAFLWSLQTSITPDRSCLYPLLDFEEHFQKVFLRRGLIIYCTLVLRNFETYSELPADQLTLSIL